MSLNRKKFLILSLIAIYLYIFMAPSLNNEHLTKLHDQLLINTKWKMFAPNPPIINNTLKIKFARNNKVQSKSAQEFLKLKSYDEIKKMNMYINRALNGGNKEVLRQEFIKYIKKNKSYSIVEVEINKFNLINSESESILIEDDK